MLCKSSILSAAFGSSLYTQPYKIFYSNNMKTLLCLWAAVAMTAGHKLPDTSSTEIISNIVIAEIERMRDQMPCGFPDKGIPPLAPFVIPQKHVNVYIPSFKLNGSIQNFHLNGMNNFDIAEMKVNVMTNRATFRFIFDNVNVDTWYDLKLFLKKSGFTINMVGRGPAMFAIKNLQIWGTMKYSWGILSNKMKLNSLKIRTRIGEVESDIVGIMGKGAVNEKINKILEDIVKFAINEHEDLISEIIEDNGLPLINRVLDKNKLRDLIGATTECTTQNQKTERHSQNAM